MVRTFFWLGVLGFFLLGLGLFSGILFPFIIGLSVAYFLDPLCDRLEAIGCSRALSAVIVLVSFFGFLVLLLFVLLPPLYVEFLGFIDALPSYWVALQLQIENLRQTPLFGQFLNLWESGAVSDHSEQIIGFLVIKLQNLSKGLGSLFNLISLFLITPIISFYLLRDWDRLVDYIRNLVPLKHQEVVVILARDMDKALSNYVRGQLLVCLILGISLGVALHFLGVPYGFMIGLCSGFLSFIPYLGQITGGLIALTVAYVSSQSYILPLWVLLVFVGGNLLEGLFLTPRFVGGSIGVHAVWVIFSLLAGATLLGFLGIILALPFAACFSVLVRFGVEEYRKSSIFKH